jgi:DNA-binding response OmpR family regulator
LSSLQLRWCGPKGAPPCRVPKLGEDNFVVADALRYLIDGYGGFVSTIVPTLEQAFAVLVAARVDIAVLDVNLNGTSVVPFAEHLHAEGVPYIFLTGYGDEELTMSITCPVK